MMTLDLTQTHPSQWPEQIFGALAQNYQDKSAPDLAEAMRHHQLRQLESRERGLIAELKDVRTRIVLLQTEQFPSVE